MPTPSLKEFVQATPVCEQTSGFADVLEIFRSSECEAIVLVSSQNYPLGVVNLPKLMPHLIYGQQSENTAPTRADRIFHKPLSQLEPSIIEPLVILPAQLSLSEFWSYLQEHENTRVTDQINKDFQASSLSASISDHFPVTLTPHYAHTPLPRQQWALVDEEGKFLGLLNSWLLLKSLAPKFAHTQTSDVDHLPDQIMSFKPLVQLLEHLPLPLSLQTTTGQVLAQNLTWRQQIGIAPNLDWLRRTTAAMLDVPAREAYSGQKNVCVSDGCIPLQRQTAKTPCASLLSVSSFVQQPYKTSELSAVQRFCAIDTPRLATTVSTKQVVLSEPPINSTQKPPTNWDTSNRASETPKKSQERVFSFVTIPLSPSVFSSPIAGEWEKEPDIITSFYDPNLWDLCVVVAQDTTEQQQFAKELAAKNADLVQLNRLKDEFLACISHELKTPLTAVLGLSSLLKDQALGKLNERQSRYARLIYQSGRQLMTLVNDILDLTRMETGQLELTLDPTQIQNVCDRAYTQACQLQQDKDSEEESTTSRKFTLEIESGLDMLVADELRLRQMLVHLLSNALKFTETGGEIGLSVNRWEGWIAFTVWDTGIGIPPEKQHLIFQKFQQLEQPLTRRFEGTGLGLVLTQRLARLHGGDVSFTSKADEGSEFTLLLPPCPPQAKRSDGEIPHCPIPNSECPIRNRLVLIVETVPRYLDGLTEQLQSLGYRVVIARSGTEAIEKARGLQPRVIFLNPLVPQLSGWDVLTLLKSDAQTRHIPVLVTATQAEKQQAFQNHADGFLSLPVQNPDLLESLTGLDIQENSHKSKVLTILYLSFVEDCPHPSVNLHTQSDKSPLTFGLTDMLNLPHSEFNYRVLEADDLEQAELLARVWHPDVVLLDAAKIANPLTYLQQFVLYSDLVSIPMVTLDHRTTEAANQVSGLSVYPCLAPDNSAKMTALLQVIQVAAGMSRMPSLVVIDIGEQELTNASKTLPSQIPPSSKTFARPVRDSFTPSDYHKNTALTGDIVEEDCDRTSTRRNRFGRNTAAREKNSSSAPVTPQSSWLQAMMQYLQTAGFRTLLSCSWTELYHQLQEQSADLVLIRIKDVNDDSLLVKRLMNLTQLPKLPPIVVLDHRVNTVDNSQVGQKDLEVAAHSTSHVHQDAIFVNNSSSTLDSLLNSLATKIVRGHSLSMSQLLEQINQALGM